ncbi:MAG: J domain-containing protein [Myxococcota bacterium]
MDHLPGATSLARALMALARSRATGVLTVQSGVARARLGVVDGTPRAVALEGVDDEPLGDLLARDGAIDPRVHARALRRGVPRTPIGRWLVAMGAASEPAVAHALRTQLRRRVQRMFRWPDTEYRFASGSADIGLDPLDEPVAVGDLVLGAMREAVEDVPLDQAAREIGEGMLVLTPLGDAVVDDAALWPAEAAMVPLLRRGVDAQVALAVAGRNSRAIRTLWALKLLHAVAEPQPAAAAYPLLLRKHRQVRRAADPTSLLDLDPSAPPDEARQALRRLAGALHPDRFQSGAPPGVRSASAEVMSALVSAEARVRSRSR